MDGTNRVPLLSLPLESRTSISDYVSRNVTAVEPDPQRTGPRMRSWPASDTAGLVDGLRLDRLSLPMLFIERVDVLTAGLSAELADVPGGAVEVATRSGSNRLQVDVDTFHERRSGTTSVLGVGTFRERHSGISTVVEPAVSGPLLRDRLFLVVSGRFDLARAHAEPDPTGIVGDIRDPTRKELALALKLSWLPEPRHRIDVTTIVDASRSDNLGGMLVAADAQPAFDEGGSFASIAWRGRFSDRVTVSSRLGLRRSRWEEMPMQCRQDRVACDTTPSSLQTFPGTYYFERWPTHEEQREHGWEIVNSVESMHASGARAQHRLRAVSRARGSTLANQHFDVGNYLTRYNGATPDRRTEYFAGNARSASSASDAVSAGSTLRTIHSLEDQLRLFDRLWVTPSVALVTSRARAEGAVAVDDVAVAPGAALAWDATADRRTWLWTSSQRRVDADLDELTRFARPGTSARECRFNPNDGTFNTNCVWSGGERRTVGLPCGPSGIAADGSSCKSALSMPRVLEHAMGARRAISAGVAVDLDLVYRRSDRLAVSGETNRVWQSTTTDQGSGFRSGRAEQIFDWSNADPAQRRYLGTSASVHRGVGAFRFMLAYTFSKTDNYEGVSAFGLPWGLSARSAVTDSVAGVPDHHHHAIRAQATYQGDFASVGLLYAFDSGRRTDLRFRNDVTGSFADYRTQVGLNPGTNMGDPAYEPPRTPSLERLNLRLSAHLAGLTGLDVDAYLDVINVFDAGKTEGSFWSFIEPPRTQEPRWVRFGASYRY